MDEEKSIASRILRIAIFFVVLLILLSVFHSQGQLTSVKVINKTTAYSEEEIKKLVFTSPLDRYAVLFRLRWFFAAKKNHPFIEKIDVKLLDKNSIELTAYEKRIIGCVQIMGRFFYFDRDGLVVESSDRRLPEIPLVEGLEFDNIVLHKTLTVQKTSLFQVILNLARLIELYRIDADKITFLYDNAVVLSCGQTKVQLGKHENYDAQLSALNDLIAKLSDKNMVLHMENYSERNKDVIAKPKQ